MRKVDEIFRKKYGEDYSIGYSKRIVISDLSDYKILTTDQPYNAVHAMDFVVGKTIKGVYIESKNEFFIVFTDKTYCHVVVEEDGFYLYDESYEHFAYFRNWDGVNYTPTKLCNLLEVDEALVLQIQREMNGQDKEDKDNYEYKRYLELDKKYGERKKREEVNGNI